MVNFMTRGRNGQAHRRRETALGPGKMSILIDIGCSPRSSDRIDGTQDQPYTGGHAPTRLTRLHVDRVDDRRRDHRHPRGDRDTEVRRAHPNVGRGRVEGNPRPSLTIGGKYLSVIPVAKTPNYHSDRSAVYLGTFAGGFQDLGGWIFDSGISDQYYGIIWVDCTHTDTKGSVWTFY